MKKTLSTVLVAATILSASMTAAEARTNVNCKNRITGTASSFTYADSPEEIRYNLAGLRNTVSAIWRTWHSKATGLYKCKPDK